MEERKCSALEVNEEAGAFGEHHLVAQMKQ
jgi:hypothetical protein